MSRACRIGLCMLLLLSLVVLSVYAAPSAPDVWTNISNQSPAPSAGLVSNTSGGTITYVNINATTQNPHWKAYVGNVSGQLALMDASGSSVYNWSISSMEGEIYATRDTSIVDWDNIVCADLSHIQAEEIALNMTTNSVDSIARTFTEKSHASFYAGSTSIAENTCNSTNLYVNSQDSSDYEQLLLYDGSHIVHTSLIEDSATGFDGTEYDFQMVLPDSGLEGNQVPETYYFYVELT